MTLSSVVRCRLLLAVGVDADLLDSGVLVLAVQGRFLPFPLPFAEGGGWSSSRPEMAGPLFLRRTVHAGWLTGMVWRFVVLSGIVEQGHPRHPLRLLHCRPRVGQS